MKRSARGISLRLCVALLLTFSITLSSFPGIQSGIFVANTGRKPTRRARGGQQPGSAPPTRKAQPQKTPPQKAQSIGPIPPQAVVITATNRDSFPNHGDGKAHQGDAIDYTVAITNSGDTN